LAYENSKNLVNINLADLKNKLIELMETSTTDKIGNKYYVFSDENLNLEILAQKLSETLEETKINPHQLSEFINSQFFKNFRSFINGYRIKQAKKLLEELSKSHLSTLRIGGMVGFRSESIFIKTFNQEIGMNPGLYRRNFFNGKIIFKEKKNNDLKKDFQKLHLFAVPRIIIRFKNTSDFGSNNDIVLGLDNEYNFYIARSPKDKIKEETYKSIIVDELKKLDFEGLNLYFVATDKNKATEKINNVSNYFAEIQLLEVAQQNNKKIMLLGSTLNQIPDCWGILSDPERYGYQGPAFKFNCVFHNNNKINVLERLF
jgi:AraC-like DNA-binding protein